MVTSLGRKAAWGGQNRTVWTVTRPGVGHSLAVRSQGSYSPSSVSSSVKGEEAVGMS